ncbi:pectin methylesterase1 [Zea mays]|uniref:Pectin methylesterase1 n=1 Tax=Zea mays TaxID=4577 RepID=A0A1D6J7W8_MAIZE|nr:pectin methylesterase1 [Zea mays]
MAKALLGGLSAILVVAVVVGVVATVTRSGKKAGDNFTVPGEASLATSGKSVKSLCAPTLYKESCEKTLSQATNGTENPKEVFHSVAKVALESVQTAVEQSKSIGEAKASDSMTESAREDCKKLLEDAADSSSWRAPSPTSSSQRGTCPGTATSPSRRSTTPSTTTAGPAPAPARGSTGPASTSSDGRRPSRSPPGRSSTAPCGSSTPARRTYLVSSSKGRMAWHTSHHI